MSKIFRAFFAYSAAISLLTLPVSAQQPGQEPAPLNSGTQQAPPQKQTLSKEQKQKIKRTFKELEQFIEQFWLRRSSNPDLPDNDFKEEHYRRIAYANEHFASGIPGWKTDRGRMYIMW